MTKVHVYLRTEISAICGRVGAYNYVKIKIDDDGPYLELPEDIKVKDLCKACKKRLRLPIIKQGQFQTW